MDGPNVTASLHLTLVRNLWHPPFLTTTLCEPFHCFGLRGLTLSGPAVQRGGGGWRGATEGESESEVASHVQVGLFLCRFAPRPPKKNLPSDSTPPIQVALGPGAKGPISLQVTADTPDDPIVCVLCTLSAGRVRALAITRVLVGFCPPPPHSFLLMTTLPIKPAFPLARSVLNPRRVLASGVC